MRKTLIWRSCSCRESIDVLDQFKVKMDAAAAEMTTKERLKYRDQIQQLRKLQERQYVHGAAGDDVCPPKRAVRTVCRVFLFARVGF